jgi:CRP/FNR family cyclic AMP-dependent transcriptional regulator
MRAKFCYLRVDYKNELRKHFMVDKKVVLERLFVPAGTLIMKQGEDGNCAYLIQSGAASVYTEHNGKRVELAQLELGQIVGEMALIFDEPRTASVQAIEDTNLIVLTREVFDQKLRRTDPTIRATVEMLNRRIISANKAVLESVNSSNSAGGTSLDEMVDAVHLMYQNTLTAMPREKQGQFQDAALGKLDDFLAAVRNFK